MNVSFPDVPPTIASSGAVHFAASVDGRPVDCSITEEALFDRYRSGGPRGSEAAFHEHRPDIERVARRLIQLGRVSPAGRLVITARAVEEVTQPK